MRQTILREKMNLPLVDDLIEAAIFNRYQQAAIFLQMLYPHAVGGLSFGDEHNCLVQKG